MNELRSFNGERLKLARSLRGLSTSELAERLGVQRQTISMYENGKITDPDFQKIKKMSDTLNFPIDFFLDQKFNSDSQYKSTYFRSLLTTGKKYRYEQEIKVEFISVICSFINEYIDFPELVLPDVSGINDIEIIASELRTAWKLGNGPIDNLVYHSEKNGLIVTSFETGTNDIDAFSKKVSLCDSDRYIIAYSNNKNTAARIHFDVSHELGHILLHDWDDDISELSPQEFREKEQEANDFASAFLLPRESFIRDVGRYADKFNYYVELKKKWKVSIAAMIRRSLSLDLISYERYQQMMRYMQKLGIRKQEPLDDILVTSVPTMLETAVNMLINGNVVSPKEFIQELSMDYNLSLYPDQIESLLGLKNGTLTNGTIAPSINLTIKK